MKRRASLDSMSFAVGVAPAPELRCPCLSGGLNLRDMSHILHVHWHDGYMKAGETSLYPHSFITRRKRYLPSDVKIIFRILKRFGISFNITTKLQTVHAVDGRLMSNIYRHWVIYAYTFHCLFLMYLYQDNLLCITFLFLFWPWHKCYFPIVIETMIKDNAQ